MTGPKDKPGICTRAMSQIFDTAQRDSARYSITVKAYMLELYNDRLIDLLGEVRREPNATAEKLSVKKDDRVWV